MVAFIWGAIGCWFLLCGVAAMGRHALKKKEEKALKALPKGKPVSKEKLAEVINLQDRRNKGIEEANKVYKS